ncbi:MAG: FliM/FliN family flagellar motor switch protein [Candidatus Melainabacteria bacterium]|nr:FliM/FliN family flagellar motor switch protein [Candidatus Melainabacteria bacterium]
MIKNKNKELIRQLGINPFKPDSFQIINEPLMDNLHLWSNEKIEINDVIQNFFGIKVRTKLIAILLDLDPNNWIGIGASWQHNSYNGQIRIDSKLTEFLLNQTFGESPVNRPFNIKKVNELELNILQSFLGGVETKMKGYWEVDAKHPFLMDLIYLVWVVQSNEGEIGRIAYGIPASFRPKEITKTSAGDIVDLNKLANTGIKVPVGFLVGGTKLSFNEIKSIELEDLIIFEDSDTSKFNWHLGEISLVLPEEDHPVYLKEIGNINELASEMIRPKNIEEDPLSSLPLELTAEFQKIMIPLKQVLELKSGGVLPLGSVLDSELVLTAQGKPVAKGELVIVGNQFGLRVTDLLIGAKRGLKGSPGGVEINDLIDKQESKSEKKATFADELENLEES